MNKQADIIHAVNNLKDGEEMVLTAVSSKGLKGLLSSKSKTKKPHAFQRTKHVSASMQSLLGRIKSPEKPKNATEIPKNSQTESLVMVTQEEVEAIMDAVIRSFSHDKSITFSEIDEVGWGGTICQRFEWFIAWIIFSGGWCYWFSDFEYRIFWRGDAFWNWEFTCDAWWKFWKKFWYFCFCFGSKKRRIINFDLGKIHHPAIRAVALHIDRNSDNFYKNFDVNFNFSK